LSSEQRVARVKERHSGGTRLLRFASGGSPWPSAYGQRAVGASCFTLACCLEVLRPRRQSSLV